MLAPASGSYADMPIGEVLTEAGSKSERIENLVS